MSTSEPTESEAWFDRYVAEHGHDPGPPEPDLGTSRHPDRLITAMDAARERREVPEGDYLYADVIVAMSDKARSLPPTVFDGPHDSRWEFDTATGAYRNTRAEE